MLNPRTESRQIRKTSRIHILHVSNIIILHDGVACSSAYIRMQSAMSWIIGICMNTLHLPPAVASHWSMHNRDVTAIVSGFRSVLTTICTCRVHAHKYYLKLKLCCVRVLCFFSSVCRNNITSAVRRCGGSWRCSSIVWYDDDVAKLHCVARSLRL